MRVGILGGGQLGRMLAQAASALNVSCSVFAPEENGPAAQVTRLYKGAFDDLDALQAWARTLDVVSYEFEHLPLESVNFLAQHVAVRPSSYALKVTQDRNQEKNFLAGLGIATAPFHYVEDERSLKAAADAVGFPAILKRCREGYDGKGQVRVGSLADLVLAHQALDTAPCVLEKELRLRRELSIIGVSDGDRMATYDLVENVHHQGILRYTCAPEPAVDAKLVDEAQAHCFAVMRALKYQGVLALELFECDDGLLANEIAPRVHNSGHWTIEGARCSQFENHLRAICGLELGPALTQGFSLMVNFIGEVPERSLLRTMPEFRVHLYDKAPRKGRKLGHMTAVYDTAQERDASLARVKALGLIDS